MKTEYSIIEAAKTLADNLNGLIIGLAKKIEELEKENAELKRKLEANTDDLK